MTDNEIIKANDLCSKMPQQCKDCPFCKFDDCVRELAEETINLINRQKANAEGLTNAVKFLNEQLSSAKAEIERLQERDETAEKIIREQADTILRLKDENSRLNKKCENSLVALIAAKAEAVKEFAERLKFEKATGMNWFGKEHYSVRVEEIDNLVKEMVGEG